MKINLKISSASWRPYCLGFSVFLNIHIQIYCNISSCIEISCRGASTLHRMMPLYRNVIYITARIWGESVGQRCIPKQRASDTELYLSALDRFCSVSFPPELKVRFKACVNTAQLNGPSCEWHQSDHLFTSEIWVETTYRLNRAT